MSSSIDCLSHNSLHIPCAIDPNFASELFLATTGWLLLLHVTNFFLYKRTITRGGPQCLYVHQLS